MAAPLILARTFKDAHAFAEEKLGLRIGYYRVVNSAGTIKACRNVNLYLVPGWDKRPDRFTMQSAIKWCRLNVIDTAKEPVPTVEISVVPDDTEVPQHHVDMVAKVLPTSTPVDVVGDFFDFPTDPEDVPVKPACLDCGFENGHEDDCPAKDSNVLETEPETPEPAAPVERPKGARRSRCKKCEQLHFKDESCPTEAE